MSLVAKSHFRLDRKYFEQVHRDWIRHVSRWRRFTQAISGLLMVAGIALLALAPSNRWFGLALLITGAIQMAQYHLHHRKWIRDRTNEKSFGQDVEIQFSEDKIHIRGPHSSGFCMWEAFQRCRVTPSGMFLWPRKGVHIYIPDSSLEPPEAKPEIARRIGSGQA